MKTEETNPAPLGESSEEQKTSADWYLQHPEPIVMDPDGWDRKNWQFSWYEERITLREFEKRRLMSTVRLNTIRPPSPTSEPPELKQEIEVVYMYNEKTYAVKVRAKSMIDCLVFFVKHYAFSSIIEYKVK